MSQTVFIQDGLWLLSETFIVKKTYFSLKNRSFLSLFAHSDALQIILLLPNRNPVTPTDSTKKNIPKSVFQTKENSTGGFFVYYNNPKSPCILQGRSLNYNRKTNY